MAADPTTTTTTLSTMPVTVRIEAAEIKGRVSLVDSENESKQEDVDLFRHTPVRYLGYANEVGEAFRAQVHVRVVHLSYLVATGYVIADAAHKGQQAKELSGQHDPDGLGKVLTAVTDTLIWQGLASVVIPGFTINRICKASHFLLSRSTSLPLPTRKWMTTAVGLCCIPFIISPIDKSVDYLLNNTLRKWVKLRDIEEVVHHKRND